MHKEDFSSQMLLKPADQTPDGCFMAITLKPMIEMINF